MLDPSSAITVPRRTLVIQMRNVAAVAIHADLPPFSRPGQTIDITVSSIGKLESLRGA